MLGLILRQARCRVTRVRCAAPNVVDVANEEMSEEPELADDLLDDLPAVPAGTVIPDFVPAMHTTDQPAHGTVDAPCAVRSHPTFKVHIGVPKVLQEWVLGYVSAAYITAVGKVAEAGEPVIYPDTCEMTVVEIAHLLADLSGDAYEARRSNEKWDTPITEAAAAAIAGFEWVDRHLGFPWDGRPCPDELTDTIGIAGTWAAHLPEGSPVLLPLGMRSRHKVDVAEWEYATR